MTALNRMILIKLTIYDLHKLLISHLQVAVVTNARAIALKLPLKIKIYISRFIGRPFDRLSSLRTRLMNLLPCHQPFYRT